MFWQILFFSRSKIDETWTAIAKAVVGGTSVTATNMFESDIVSKRVTMSSVCTLKTSLMRRKCGLLNKVSGSLE